MKVLAAFDFGDSSLEALRQARALAHGLGGTLAVCHVRPAIPYLEHFFPERSLVTDEDVLLEDEKVRAELEAHARDKLGLELDEVFIEHGTPYAELVRRAESYQADFVVLGTHGRTGLAHVVLGSVAERVTRHVHCSVLVARAVAKPGVVLAATDLSDLSLPAIAAAAAAAKRSNAKLVVASVIDWDGVAAGAAGGLIGAMPVVPPADVQRQVRQSLEEALGQAVARAGAQAEIHVLDGSPAAEIVAHAEELQAELLVVGTHGRTGLARLALGSVAERVIQHARCSVLAVRQAKTG